ncbi:MAG: DUF2029 domain-containing protein [Myxococcaceae bacterium]|nr:DUF2029 domain-containing protein [Myxococcaceae bacterium]
MRRVLADAWQQLVAWLRRHPRWAAALFTVVTGNVVYACFRAVMLSAVDLVHGYLDPTRAMLFEGADPFVAFRFNSYSPFFYAVMAPLALMPDGVASVVWSVLQLGFLFAVVAFFRAMLGRAEVALGLGAAAVLVSDNVNLGQSNLLALAFCAASLWALSKRRDVTAGLSLAVAIAWKLTPALLLVLLIARGRVKALGAVLAGLVVCLVVVPGLVFGPARAVTFAGEWVGLVVAPFARGEKGVTTNIDWYHTNQSMEAALQRSFTRYGREHYAGAHRFVDPAFFDEAQVHGLANVLRLVLLVALAWASWRTRLDDEAVPRVGALLLLGALFISPASWFSHYIAALPAYLVALSRGARRVVLVVALATLASLGSEMKSYSLVVLSHAVLFVLLFRNTSLQTRAVEVHTQGPR